MNTNYSISNDFKLYIWDDWYAGGRYSLAVAVASSLEEAKALVMEEYGMPARGIEWGDYYTKPLNKPFAVHCCGWR
tara:strand:- start:213 stop:440 length:228 start_codon:yes stop_codon:yes gene_type:complete